MEGEDPLVVWGTGQQTRSFVDAQDIAKALIMLAETPEAYDAQPVNIGSDVEYTIGQVAAMVCDATRRSPTIEFDTSRPDGHARRASNVARLRNLIDWVPDTPIEDTLLTMVEDYKLQRSREWM